MEQLFHQPNSKDLEWNESYYFVFADNENDIKGMSRIGIKPNKKEGMSFFFLFLPDGSVAASHITERLETLTNPLNVGRMFHFRVEDGSWKFSFDGYMITLKNPEDLPKARENPSLISGLIEVRMAVDFHPISDTYEYSEYMSEESLDLGKKAGDEHWEQIGLVSGDIAIGDDNYKITDVMGQRDHTHGIRDWTGVGDWLYYVIWFNKDLCINPAAIVAEDGRVSTGGFLFKDGKNIPLKTIEILDQKFREDGVFPVSSKLKIVDWEDEEHILTGKVGPIIPVPFKDSEENLSYLIQAFGEFEMDGRKGGYGTFETLRKT